MTVIAFEGIDGAGKTTLAEAVKQQAKSYGYKSATIYTYPYQPNRSLPERHRITRKYPHGFDHETDWLMWATSYFTQMHYLSRTKLHTPANELIILDRWSYSTRAYAPDTMPPRVREKILGNLAGACESYYGTKLSLPDLWVHCKTDPAKPLRRPSEDYLDEASPQRRALIEARYEHYFRNDPYVTSLDTDRFKVDKCVEIIYRRIRPAYFVLTNSETGNEEQLEQAN